MSQAGALGAGTVFAGDFRLVRPLGKGGMGEVYVAEQLSTGKQRALKLLHAELAHYPALRARFAQEARVASLIDSEHVVEVVAAGVDPGTGRPWLAMELLEGADLARHVASTGPVAPLMVRELMLQICHALSAAHRAGIVHRDLKPENIFVARSRQQNVPFKVKVLDFGIAKLLAEARSAAQTTMGLGTPLWMAPEQADARGAVGPQADVWALGLIVFWMLTGRSFWREASSPTASVVTLMKEVLVEPIAPASVKAAELGCADRIPPGFDAWFAACTARDPRTRLLDAGQAMAALDAVLPAMPAGQTAWVWPQSSAGAPPYAIATAMTPGAYGGSQAPLTSSTPVAPKTKRWAWAAGILGVAAVLGLGLVAIVGTGVAWQLGAFDGAKTSAPPDRAPDLSGSYAIVDSQNPGGGGAYQGSVLVTRQADAYRVAWTITGGQGYDGVGLMLDQTFAVGYAQGRVHGLCAYRLDGGKLRGKCTSSMDGGKVMSEELEGPPGLSGSYTISKSYAGRAGTVTIAQRGDVFDVVWPLEAGGWRGLGIRSGDQLLVGWAAPSTAFGIVAYRVEPGQMTGRWAMPGDPRLGRETIVKR